MRVRVAQLARGLGHEAEGVLVELEREAAQRHAAIVLDLLRDGAGARVKVRLRLGLRVRVGVGVGVYGELTWIRVAVGGLAVESSG